MTLTKALKPMLGSEAATSWSKGASRMATKVRKSMLSGAMVLSLIRARERDRHGPGAGDLYIAG